MSLPFKTPGDTPHPVLTDFVRQAGDDIYARLNTMNEILAVLEKSLPVQVYPAIDRIHSAIAELVTLLDCVIVGEYDPAAACDFSSVYRDRLTQISVRLYRLQRESCGEHHEALDLLQNDVLSLGIDYPAMP